MMKGSLIVCLLATALALIVFAPPGEAATYYVDDDDATQQWSNFTVIQDAINVSGTGDSIYVYNGTYYENIVVNQSVLMYGNGSDETVIDGGDNGDIVSIESNSVSISGFGIQNAANGQDGIDIDANDFTLDNCSVSDCNYRGIYALSQIELAFINCEISVYGTGINSGYCDYVVVLWCDISYCNIGVDLGYPEYHEIRNTTFTNCGIDWSANAESNYNTNTVDNCTVNGRPIVFYTEVDNMTISGDIGQLILGTSADIDIEDLTASKGSVGIHVGYCNRVTIWNVSVNETYYGITILQSNQVVISDTEVLDFRSLGVEVIGTDNIDIINLTASTFSNVYGITVFSGCDNVNISHSSITTGRRGINSYADGCTVTNCTFDNGWNCIWLNGGDGWTIVNNTFTSENDAIYFNNCDGNLIANNTVKNCGWNGIHLSSSENNTIIYNEIFGCGYEGVRFRTSGWGNVVHHNNFYDNGGGSSQGLDDVGNNTWDDGVSEGNYWDDWGGTGTYDINGAASAEDRYPLEYPVNNSAPEKIPEFHLFVPMAAFLVLMAFFRRRRK